MHKCCLTTAVQHGCLISTARRSYASAVLGVVFLPVCLSHACFVAKPNNAL